MTGDRADLGVAGAAEAIRGRLLTATELVDACLARIQATEGELQAWATVDATGAREQAAERDAAVDAGERLGPLHGVPVGIKDIVDVAGLVSTLGAPPFAHRRPDRDATAVARLRAAGAVILGKTVSTPFAFKDPAATRNPWSAGHTPGGSSSGSAASVAARHVPASIGTQTVGSILRPAAFCGVVGLKGDHGSVPVEGVFPLSRTFDHVGTFARSVADAALVQGVLRGEPVTSPVFEAEPRIGIAPELLGQASPPLRRHLDEVLERLRAAGAAVVPVDLAGWIPDVVAACFPILEAEAAAVHASSYRRHAAEYPPHIAALVEAGLARRHGEIDVARRARQAFIEAVRPALDEIDALLSPVAPGPAPLRAVGTGDPNLCAPWSFAGVPAISLPSGVDATGLPLAVQLVAGRGGLAGLLGIAGWVERVVGIHTRPGEAAPG